LKHPPGWRRNLVNVEFFQLFGTVLFDRRYGEVAPLAAGHDIMIVADGDISASSRSTGSDVSAVMSTPIIRLFALEHPFYGLLAVIVAHVGSSRAKKATEDANKHKAIAIFFSIVVVLLLILMPWGRPLLRGF